MTQVPPAREAGSLNREELIQLAIQTAKQNPQGARVMLQKVLSEDPRNERALLWMAHLTRNPTDRRRYLVKVLKVNPDNAAARKELQRMAHTEKAKSNRTLIFGVLIVGGFILIVILAVLFAVILSG